MRLDRLVVALITVLILGLAVAWLLRGSRALELVTPPQPHAVNLREANIVLRHQGEKQAEVHAGFVEVSRDLRYAVFKRITDAAWFDRGRLSLRLRADEIVLDRQMSDLTIHGHIEVTAPQGDRLVAAEAQWINSQRRLIFTNGVKVKLEGSEVQASRLTVAPDLQAFELAGAVEITFRLRKTAP